MKERLVGRSESRPENKGRNTRTHQAAMAGGDTRTPGRHLEERVSDYRRRTVQSRSSVVSDCSCGRFFLLRREDRHRKAWPNPLNLFSPARGPIAGMLHTVTRADRAALRRNGAGVFFRKGKTPFCLSQLWAESIFPLWTTKSSVQPPQTHKIIQITSLSGFRVQWQRFFYFFIFYFD